MKPRAQEHCPFCGWQWAPFSHWHWCIQSWPYRPLGHTETRVYSLPYLTVPTLRGTLKHAYTVNRTWPYRPLGHTETRVYSLPYLTVPTPGAHWNTRIQFTVSDRTDPWGTLKHAYTVYRIWPYRPLGHTETRVNSLLYLTLSTLWP